MIEAEHALVIDADIDHVWRYVQDIGRWAELFPGCRECEVVDEHDSRWTIKVGTGGMVKTVRVLVHVDQWDGPRRVDFSYRLETEPVTGSGSYTASRMSDIETEIGLQLRVQGNGQMAAMWEAICKPLLPQMARTFAGRLKGEIEGPVPVHRASFFATLARWWRKLWRIGQ